MSPERLGYLLLGIFLAAAGVYVGLVARRQASPQPPTQTEAGAGETPLPSTSELDAILAALPTGEPFDPATIDWLSYTDGQDGFALVRPREWSLVDEASPQRPEARHIAFVDPKTASRFSVFPRGEFDRALPSRPPVATQAVVGGEQAVIQEWDLPDGSWFARITFSSPQKKHVRLELLTSGPAPRERAILQEMLNRFQFLP